MAEAFNLSRSERVPDNYSLAHWCHVFDCRELFPEFDDKATKTPRCIFHPYRAE